MIRQKILTTTISEAECRKIHKAIHSNLPIVTFHNGTSVPVTYGSNGCRKVVYKNITFMEQNKHKASYYGEMARKGMHITWGIRPGSWILITDTVVKL